MPKISQEELLLNLDFTCSRCQAECVKLNAAEPELGYLSKVDGSFVGPLCQACWNELELEERKIRGIPETMFLVIVRPEGEGVQVTTEGINNTYLRDATPYDVMSACRQIDADISEAMLVQKITSRINVLQKDKSKILLPR